METKTVAKVNNVSIVVNRGDKELVPIKPICEALGVAANKQMGKIREHPILSSVATLGVSTGSDGKEYEILSSTACMIKAVASDEKEREKEDIILGPTIVHMTIVAADEKQRESDICICSKTH
jgi:hypothetical protein